MRRWKLSDMDVLSITKWEDYSRAKDAMMEHTSTDAAPWWTVESDDKRAARVNVISHILSQIPYFHEPLPTVEIPERPHKATTFDPRLIHKTLFQITLRMLLGNTRRTNSRPSTFSVGILVPHMPGDVPRIVTVDC